MPDKYKSLQVVDAETKRGLRFPYAEKEEDVLVSSEELPERLEATRYDINMLNRILTNFGIESLDVSDPDSLFKRVKSNELSLRLQEKILQSLENGEDIKKRLETLYQLCSIKNTVSAKDKVDVLLVAGSISGNRVRGVSDFVKNQKDALLALSGGNHRLPYPEENVQTVSELEMQIIEAIKQGIDPNRIVGESESFSTYENIERLLKKLVWVKQVLGKDNLRIAVSTSPYHSKRFYSEVNEIIKNLSITDKLEVFSADTPYKRNNYWQDGDGRSGKSGIFFILEENRKIIYNAVTKRGGIKSNRPE